MNDSEVHALSGAGHLHVVVDLCEDFAHGVGEARKRREVDLLLPSNGAQLVDAVV